MRISLPPSITEFGLAATPPTAAAPDIRLSLRAAADHISSSAMARTAWSVVCAAAALLVAPPAPLAAWLAFVVLWEFALRPMLYGAVLARPRREGVGFGLLAAINFVGALGHGAFPIMVWGEGGDVGVVLAVAWIAAGANHVCVYFAGHPTLLAGNLAPLLLVAAAAPLTRGAADPPTLGVIVILLATIAAAIAFGQDRRLLMRALARQTAAREAAEQAHAAKSRFIALMSHELRTPLNAVIGYAEIIANEPETARADDAHRIVANAHRLLRHLNMMLDVAALDAGAAALAPAPVSLDALMAELKVDAEGLAPGRIEASLPPDLGVAILDETRFRRVVLELVANAALHGGDGTVRVSAARQAHDGRAWVAVRVSDSGPGIAAADLERVFEPFEQGDISAARPHGGAGLGLAVARRSARLMGGELLCESTPGRGATFVLTVPAAPRAL